MPNLFIDKADITVKAGNGGNGAVSFQREKYITSGGPDGGDGGRGGDIIIKTDRNLATLMDFRYKRKYTAQNGVDGSGRKMSGRNAEPLVIKVPEGTIIRDRQSGGIIVDMSGLETYVLAKGGNGGWGNQHFATPTRQAPRFARPGKQGALRDITLELKLIADVGLAGLPNAGKSTLLAACSNAKPKIADYHFTTLYPNLGLVYISEGESFVMADIPGLIEGASQGAGLGHDFLRHIERCRLLIHVVDVSGSEGRSPVDDIRTVMNELREHSESLAGRPMIIAANKCDILDDDSIENLEAVKAEAERLGAPMAEISGATGRGVKDLCYKAYEMLKKLPPIEIFTPTYTPEPEEALTPETVEIIRDGDSWKIEGPWITEILRGINFGEQEQRTYFNRLLEKTGINEKMLEAGVAEGDTVICGDFEFEFFI